MERVRMKLRIGKGQFSLAAVSDVVEMPPKWLL
jgi:hypothetical protein